MPKNQSTAAKRARAATRAGAKYTTALRAAGPLPPHLRPVDEGALADGERLVVDHLRALAEAGGLLPLRSVTPEEAVIKAERLARSEGRRPAWERWATVEAAVDGYVLREVLRGPNGSRYHQGNRAPRVPVPVRAEDGTVTMVAMPHWAREEHGWWIWSHTGWPVEAPGRIIDPPQRFAPAPNMWEVAAWLDMSQEDGRVLGEDYGGSASSWQTVGWCTTREDAQLIARAYVAHHGHFTRADVLQHGPDLGYVSEIRDSYLQAPDAPAQARAKAAPGPRPASPDRAEVPEMTWYGGETHPPRSSLVVWTGTAWRTLVWSDWQTSNIAAHLGIGADGPFAWAESWGPRHPDRDLHDWTQEGRELCGQFPEPPYTERSAQFAAERAAQAEALLTALAERGAMTRKEAAARLERGGEAYRQLLDVGQATICRALNTARRALPEGPERTAVRHAIDDLMSRHLLPADAVRIAGEQLDTEVEAQRAPEVTAWCRRAVAEYVAPVADPVAAGVEGFRPEDERHRARA
ncbi:hypothetical protein ACGFXC_37050 [Streptomyces sp. NPDC048507]|uniref:hypothetical protein n=1 Tax=Streptomyces sp. NPDC048507 TaxID=3365560 RepID=UPI003721DEE5